MASWNKFLESILGLFLIRRDETVEQLIARTSVDMDDDQKAVYWLHINQQAFELLGKIEVSTYAITANDIIPVVRAQYPTIAEFWLPDYKFGITTLLGMEQILSRDWVSQVKYISDYFDCDDFSFALYVHLCQFYNITTCFPVWGDTDKGYHAFNLAILKEDSGLIVRLIEPQSDKIFVSEDGLGVYTPRFVVNKLAKEVK